MAILKRTEMSDPETQEGPSGSHLKLGTELRKQSTKGSAGDFLLIGPFGDPLGGFHG